MPTLRPTRRRSRKPKNFTPAQIQYLTGTRQAEINPLEWLRFGTDGEWLLERDLDAAAALVERAGRLIDDKRRDHLLKCIQARRDRHQRYRADPHGAWAEDSKRYGI